MVINSRQIYFIFVHLFLSLFVFQTEAKSDNCHAIGERILKLSKSISPSSVDGTNAADLNEIRSVLAEACSEEYQNCNFLACQTFTNTPSLKQAVIVPTPLPNISQPTPVAIENNKITPKSPLATKFPWIEDETLSCNQILVELRKEIGANQKYSALPAKRKEEVRSLLDTVCNGRFKRCNFSACEKESNNKDPKNTKANSWKAIAIPE
jgi:hypothetical protein